VTYASAGASVVPNAAVRAALRLPWQSTMEPASDRRRDDGRRASFECDRSDLGARLRPVCGHFAPEDLHQLTVKMTRLQYKYATLTAVPFVR
jgi:hypothetical protein